MKIRVRIVLTAVRTTTAVTMLEGSKAANVLPATVSVAGLFAGQGTEAKDMEF